MKARRLSDLYVLGKEVEFGDGDIDPKTGKLLPPVAVWLQKISPIDNERAIRFSNASRAIVLALRRDRTSRDFLGLIGDVEEMSREDLVNELAAEQIIRKVQTVEAELEAEEEWSKDDYLQGLRDAWADRLWQRYAENNEDEEAKKVFDEFERFSEEANSRLNEARTPIVAEFEATNDETLREKWILSRVDSEADQAWLREYRRREVFYATRYVDNKRKYYFETWEELEELPAEIYLALVTAYREISVSVTEGKASLRTEPSSLPSESVEKEEKEDSSGPKGATK